MSLGTGNVGTIAVDSNGESQSLPKIFKKTNKHLKYLFVPLLPWVSYVHPSEAHTHLV